jgi:hypothetical protein
MKKNSKAKNRRPQTVKPVMPGRNEEWMRARLDQSNSNLRVPSGKVYKREKAGARGRDW